MNDEVREGQDWARLREMSERLEEIEGLVLALKELGTGMPVIDKKACSIPSSVYVWESGIPDVADITDKRRH